MVGKGFLPYFQVGKLFRQCFVGTGRRHVSPRARGLGYPQRKHQSCVVMPGPHFLLVSWGAPDEPTKTAAHAMGVPQKNTDHHQSPYSWGAGGHMLPRLLRLPDYKLWDFCLPDRWKGIIHCCFVTLFYEMKTFLFGGWKEARATFWSASIPYEDQLEIQLLYFQPNS